MNSPKTTPCYSVGQISRYIRGLFDRDFLLRSVRIQGELSNLKYHSSGHIYFTLKDEQAAINGIMFASSARSLKFRLRDGMKLVVCGSISTYEKSGSYQLYAQSMEELGVGELYRRFLETRSRLEELGLFDPMYKKPIPAYARSVGIVTASTGAAIRDICNICRRRNPFVRLVLCPALVQGEQAAASIVKAIETLDKMGLDVLIVGRGGGSLEDLWPFNEEAVARAIFEAETPVISAVGHETDVTISDFAADLRAPTPSAAAELAVFEWKSYMQKLGQQKERLDRAASARLGHERLRLSEQSRRLAEWAPEQQLKTKRLQLLRAEEQLDRGIRERLKESFNRLETDSGKLEAAMRERGNAARQRLQLSSARLEALSPLKALSRGYSFTEYEGRPLRSVKTVRPGNEVRVYLPDGSLLTEVKEVKHE